MPSLAESAAQLENEMLELLERLVNHESYSADLAANTAALELIKPEVEKALGRPVGITTSRGRSHLVAPVPHGVEAAVLLVGHIDTVWPMGTTERWSFTREGDKVSGPGCFDMKGGLVQMLGAVQIVGCPKDRVSIVITTDEEIGSPTSRLLIEELAKSAAAALVLEASLDGAVKIARKGVSMYRIDIEGRASHAGLDPEKGINAGIGLAQVLLEVPAIARMDIGTSVTPTTAEVGTTTNTVPAHAHVHVDVRAESVEEQLRVDAEIRALSPTLEGASISFDGGPNRPPMEKASSADLFELTQKIAAAQGIASLDGVAVGGGSDGNFTAGVGTPTLDGLGMVGGNAHAEGEWLSVAGLVERTALVAGLIEELVARAG